MEMALLPDVRKMAVLRPSALGDFIFALPALDALHSAYPQAEIVYLGREWHERFLPGRLPGSHRVVGIPHAREMQQILRGDVIDEAAAEHFFAAMREERFDLALQMHGGGMTSNPFLLQLGARYTAGLKAPAAQPLDRWIPYGYYQNEVVRLLEAAALVGASVQPGGLSPRLPVLGGDLDAAAFALDQLHRPFAVIHPGSTDPRRCWPAEKFAALADYCAEQGLQVALVGTRIEEAQASAVVSAMRAPALNLCDRLSMSGLVGVLSRASLVIGNDSGPLHVGLAVGARAVGMFWVEYLINSLPLERRRFFPLIAWQRTCPRCGKYCEKAEIDNPSGRCTHEVSFIEEITTEEAVAGVQAVLAGG